MENATCQKPSWCLKKIEARGEVGRISILKEQLHSLLYENKQEWEALVACYYTCYPSPPPLPSVPLNNFSLQGGGWQFCQDPQDPDH